jgi:hypothetical protein
MLSMFQRKVLMAVKTDCRKWSIVAIVAIVAVIAVFPP